MKSNTLLYTGMLLLFCFQSFSQFTIQSEFRPRFEYRDGYKSLRDSNTKPAALVSQRTRLIFGYKSDKITARINFQDVRTWGEEKLKADIAATAIHEAWFSFKLLDSLSLKLGRQEFVYDNERLFSNNNWAQAGNCHDAALLQFKSNSWSADFGVAYNQQSDSNLFGTDYTRVDVRSNYKSLNFIWLTKKFKTFSISGLGVADGYQKATGDKKTNFRYTYGPVINFKNKNLAVDVRGFMQSGKTQDGKEISAYFGNMDISYLVFNKLTLQAGFEYWSGYDYSDSTSSKYNAFDVLYGTGHRFNGNMDYITRPGDTKNAGLVDGYLFLIFKHSAKLSSRLDYHYFALSNNYAKNKGKEPIDKYLGSELDFSVKFDFAKDISLNFGYSAMFATTSMEVIKSDSKKGISGGMSSKYPSWAFIMLTVKPTFFKN